MLPPLWKRGFPARWKIVMEKDLNMQIFPKDGKLEKRFLKAGKSVRLEKDLEAVKTRERNIQLFLKDGKLVKRFQKDGKRVHQVFQKGGKRFQKYGKKSRRKND